MTRATITIGGVALAALEQYEAACRELAAVAPPALMATPEQWATWTATMNDIRARRDEAAELLASMVAVAMRMAVTEQQEVA